MVRWTSNTRTLSQQVQEIKHLIRVSGRFLHINKLYNNYSQAKTS